MSLSGIGIFVGPPLAGVAGLFGFIASAFTVGGRRLTTKISKHEKTVALAEAKHCSISRLISKALEDKSISDAEFNLILREIEQYYSLKDRLRSVQSNSHSSEKVDVEALKEEIKKRIPKKARITRKHKELFKS